MKNTTIKDVAQLAGVSITTVSRVLNAKPNVGEKTRKRIAAAMTALDFTPNEKAREMAFRRFSNNYISLS
ncbi:MAG: DNA-binding LacI/PurR family transcriptional regulator [Psychromonas sp.]|jgi:DNA-binding LacI/PurR family transcriptional regulator|uniref:LacI family DNA-binding transcriptional regulator n=1 Tax=Psychromonas sp. TaxID=1884585 RepID=UPI0039E34D38